MCFDFPISQIYVFIFICIILYFYKIPLGDASGTEILQFIFSKLFIFGEINNYEMREYVSALSVTIFCIQNCKNLISFHLPLHLYAIYLPNIQHSKLCVQRAYNINISDKSSFITKSIIYWMRIAKSQFTSCLNVAIISIGGETQ